MQPTNEIQAGNVLPCKFVDVDTSDLSRWWIGIWQIS